MYDTVVLGAVIAPQKLLSSHVFDTICPRVLLGSKGTEAPASSI